MRTQINKLHQTIRDVETPPAKASKNTSELGMPSTTAIRLSGRHNVRTARNGPNLDGATVGRSDSIEENDLQRALAESRQADDVTKEDEGTPLSLRGGGDQHSETETADGLTFTRHYTSDGESLYNSDDYQADENSSDEEQRGIRGGGDAESEPTGDQEASDKPYDIQQYLVASLTCTILLLFLLFLD